MCGIFGVVEPAKISEEALATITDRCLTAVLPRGPDGHQVVRLDGGRFKFSLGHARLAVIDLSEHGRQPMHERHSDWWLSYNGEIYNYREVREDLKSLGWSFEGESDSEVLLKAWVQWGVEALPRLNGMFACAVFNRGTGDLWLVRDRFGVKPLLYAQTATGGLVFSSSAAAVSATISAPVDTAYCARAVRYMVFETPGSESPFLGVDAVPAGSWVRCQLGGDGISLTSGRWYHLDRAVALKSAAIASYTDAELLAECRELLEDAVRLRLRSDVPVAVSLSGGLDSTAVAGAAARHVNGLRGFTYGSPLAPESEGLAVERFAREAGIASEYIWPSHDAAGLDALLERVLACQEAPFAGLSVMAQNEVFRRVRASGFKVLLGGQGGDEAFAGYRKFFLTAAREALRSRDAAAILGIAWSMGQMLLAEVSQATGYWQARKRFFAPTEHGFQLLNWQAPALDMLGVSGTTLAERQAIDILQFSLPSLLRYEDRNSMSYGIETRLPFLDYRLIELALVLPSRLKLARGYGKWALRAATKGSVPDHIRLERKKRGFDVKQQWIAQGLGSSLRARVIDNRAALAPHLKPGVDLDALLSDEALAGNASLLSESLMLAWLARPVRLTSPAQPALAGGLS